jgi:hypothetical protein
MDLSSFLRQLRLFKQRKEAVADRTRELRPVLDAGTTPCFGGS